MYARMFPVAALAVACCFTLVAPSAPKAPPSLTPSNGFDSYEDTDRAVSSDDSKLRICSYQVADLIMPFPPIGQNAAENPVTQEAGLIKLLLETVQPESWRTKGGAGTIEFSPLTLSLVVNQTKEVQEQISDLLATLRGTQKVQVSLEVRFITMTEEQCQPIKASERPLTDKEMARLLESMQGDRRTNVMQAPRLTLLNGQTGTVTLPQFRMTAQPLVAADRRSVIVFLKVDPGKKVNDKDQPQVPALESTVSIPHGQTVILGRLKTLTESRTDTGSSIKPVVYERGSRTVLVMVTPRVLVPEEQTPTPQTRQEKMVSDLLRACEAASAEGHDAEAGRYLRAALAIDPKCLRRGQLTDER